MPRSGQLTESANYRRLEDAVERHTPNSLKHDRSHRSSFHSYLSNTYIRGIDKPDNWNELVDAYNDFAGTRVPHR